MRCGTGAALRQRASPVSPRRWVRPQRQRRCGGLRPRSDGRESPAHPAPGGAAPAPAPPARCPGKAFCFARPCMRAAPSGYPASRPRRSAPRRHARPGSPSGSGGLCVRPPSSRCRAARRALACARASLGQPAAAPVLARRPAAFAAARRALAAPAPARLVRKYLLCNCASRAQ